jgi:hypothetical protein
MTTPVRDHGFDLGRQNLSIVHRLPCLWREQLAFTIEPSVVRRFFDAVGLKKKIERKSRTIDL